MSLSSKQRGSDGGQGGNLSAGSWPKLQEASGEPINPTTGPLSLFHVCSSVSHTQTEAHSATTVAPPHLENVPSKTGQKQTRGEHLTCTNPTKTKNKVLLVVTTLLRRDDDVHVGGGGASRGDQQQDGVRGSQF